MSKSSLFTYPTLPPPSSLLADANHLFFSLHVFIDLNHEKVSDSSSEEQVNEQINEEDEEELEAVTRSANSDDDKVIAVVNSDSEEADEVLLYLR